MPVVYCMSMVLSTSGVARSVAYIAVVAPETGTVQSMARTARVSFEIKFNNEVSKLLGACFK